MKTIIKNITGKKFNKWTVLKFSHRKIYSSQSYVYYWLCRCDCGTIKNVLRGGLLNGESKSCGCYNDDKYREVREKNRIKEIERKKQSAIRKKEREKNSKYKSWYKTRLMALSRDNWRCQHCGRMANEVHHKDMTGSSNLSNKMNNNLDNLITLCRLCHVKEEMKINPRMQNRKILTKKEYSTRKKKIFRLRQNKITYFEISKKFGITKTRIHQILNSG